MGTELAAAGAEAIWGVFSLVLLFALIGGVVYLVSRGSRKGRQRDERLQRVEERLNTLQADRCAD